MNYVDGDTFVVGMIVDNKVPGGMPQECIKFYAIPEEHNTYEKALDYAKNCSYRWPSHIGFAVLQVVGAVRRVPPAPPLAVFDYRPSPLAKKPSKRRAR